jgi:hypothetical protein
MVAISLVLTTIKGKKGKHRNQNTETGLHRDKFIHNINVCHWLFPVFYDFFLPMVTFIIIPCDYPIQRQKKITLG